MDLIEREQDDLVIERPCLEIIQNSEVIESVQIINGMIPGNITKALSGEHVGTIIYKQT
jgi:molybdenum storage protein